MGVKEAVAAAKGFILEVFQDERPINVGLEEVEFDESDKAWIVTVGFSRPWDEPRNSLAAFAVTPNSLRTYKTVKIGDQDGKVLSLKNREVPN